MCRDWNPFWNESRLITANYKSVNQEKEARLSKTSKKSNYYLQKIFKELGIDPVLIGQEEPYTFFQGIGFDWYIDEL